MKTIHASGLWSTPTAAVRAQVAAWISEHAPAEITHTEAAKHRDAFARHDGYGVAHPFGVDGKAECAIQYRLDGPPLLSSKAVPLSSLPIPRRSGDLCYATYSEFEDHHLIALHLPSGVEGADGLRDNEQARVYRDAIGGLRRSVSTLDDRPVRIVGDWNLNLRKAWVRKYLATHFPDFTPTVAPVIEGGTHGKRLIDFSLVRGYTARGEVIDNPTSDHRAISERITKERHAMKLVTRAQWGARPRGATTSTHPIGRTLGITAHWEGPHMGAFTHDQCAGKVRGIEAFHRDGRGWADIAYNALVCPHGFVFEGRGPGVKSAANGDTQTNEDWYAVCYLGGERDPFTPEGRQGYLDAFGWLAREGSAGPKRNGHRDHKATACPGDEIYRWVSALADGAGAPTVAPPAPATPTRVSKARVLLEEAADRAETNGHPRRAAAIRAGLKMIPKR